MTWFGRYDVVRFWSPRTHTRLEADGCHLIGFGCSAGRIQELFQREGLSLTVDRVDSAAVALSQMEKTRDSKKFCWLYAWNGDRYAVGGD